MLGSVPRVASPDLRGLKAFRRASPEGESIVVASDVDRSFERELLPGVRVRYMGLDELVSIAG